jgi:hypothetical protein
MSCMKAAQFALLERFHEVDDTRLDHRHRQPRTTRYNPSSYNVPRESVAWRRCFWGIGWRTVVDGGHDGSEK